MLTFLIYLIGVTDKIIGWLVLAGILSTIVGVVSFCVSTFDSIKEVKSLVKFAIIGPILFIIAALLPNSKTVVAMATIPPAIEYVQGNDELKNIPDNVIKFINNYLEEANHGKD